jgi:hypothetical protein
MNEEVLGLRKVCRETERRCVVSRTNRLDARQRDMSPYPSRRPHLAFGALLAIAMTPSALEAQADKTGEGELSAYAGAVFGMGAHPAVGGSTGTAFSRYATELIDISYMPLSSDTLPGRRLQGFGTLRLRLMYERTNSSRKTMGALWNSWCRPPL